MLYAFFWVIPRRLNFICRRFGTHCLFHLHTYPPMKMEQSVTKRRHIKFRLLGITRKKAYNITVLWWTYSWLLLTLILLMWRIGWAPNSIPIYSYNQQDATLHSLFISGNCFTCFGWYFHTSSGAYNCIYSIWYLSHRYCYLPHTQTGSNSSTIAADTNNGVTNTRCCRYSCTLLMMGGSTTRNM